MKEIKRFFGYIIFRIYRYGVKVMSTGDDNWELGGYFYLLGLPTAFTIFLTIVYIEDFFDFKLENYFPTTKSQFPIAVIIGVVNMFIISLFIPFKKVKNLTYSQEERVKYRNVFLVLLGIFVLFVLLRIKGFL